MNIEGFFQKKNLAGWPVASSTLDEQSVSLFVRRFIPSVHRVSRPGALEVVFVEETIKREGDDS